MSDQEAKTITGAAAQMGMRASAGPFGKALIDAATQRSEIVAVTADLGKYTDLYAFSQIFPERYLNVGMAEQNLVMVAGGLAQSGLVPVASTFAAFLTRRAADFTVMQVALPRANVKLIGGVPGIMSSFGPSHTSVDDIASMRAIPNMTIIDPCDGVELGAALTAALDYDGPVYLRQPFATHVSAEGANKNEPAFEIGRNVLLRKGKDVGLVASSYMVDETLKAADLLAQLGIDAAVLKVSTIKPFDSDSLLELAANTRALVTAENHSLTGGLFSTVAETLAREGCLVRVGAIGVGDSFPPFGSKEYVAKVMGMTVDDIVAKAQTVLA